MRQLFREVGKFSKSGLSFKQQRVAHNNTGKINLPYKMMQGMRAKSIQRDHNQS